MAEVTSIHARMKKKNTMYIIYRKSVVFIRVTIIVNLNIERTSQGSQNVNEKRMR